MSRATRLVRVSDVPPGTMGDMAAIPLPGLRARARNRRLVVWPTADGGVMIRTRRLMPTVPGTPRQILRHGMRLSQGGAWALLDILSRVLERQLDDEVSADAESLDAGDGDGCGV